MRAEAPAGRRIHSADCEIWDVPPDAVPDALIAVGIEDEALVRYCAAARPVYDAYKRVLGQLSGVLLLVRTGADDPAWRDRILDAAAEQLGEARERLGGLEASPPAARHHDLLGGLAGQLAALLARLRQMVLVVGADREWDRLVAELYAVHRRLLAASEPRAGMTPVDFSHACCSCGTRRRGAAEAAR